MANSWNGSRVEERRCTSCGSRNLMTIQMTFEGAPVLIRYCSDCETREWHRDGEHTEIERVMPAMRRGDARRRPTKR